MPVDGKLLARHPLNGYVYERRDDGNVDVKALDGSTAVFTPGAEHIEGELGDANPHLCTWVGGAQLAPDGNSPDECIMECIYLDPIPEHGDYTAAKGIHWLSADDDRTDAPELGMLAKVFNQDIRNLPYVQEGLHATAKEHLPFADYNETKPRHLHQLIDEWIARP